MADKYVISKSLLDNLNDKISEKTGESQRRTITQMVTAVDSMIPEEPKGGEYPNRKTEWSNYSAGTNLGTSVSAAQYAAIQSGSFEGMCIGDYWVIDGVTWRIADFDYYFGKGQSNVGDAHSTHHVVVLPDVGLYSSSIGGQVETVPSYADSYMVSEGLNDATNIVNQTFGSSHVLTMTKRVSDVDGLIHTFQAATWLLSLNQVVGDPVVNLFEPTPFIASVPEDNIRLQLFQPTVRYVITTDPDDVNWMTYTGTSINGSIPTSLFACIVCKEAGNVSIDYSVVTTAVRPAFLLKA